MRALFLKKIGDFLKTPQISLSCEIDRLSLESGDPTDTMNN